MTLEMAVDLIRETLTTALAVCSPLMVVAIVLGVAISLLQSVTSIQDQTLLFVPKLLGMSLTIIVLAHWMLLMLMEFCVQFFQKIPYMAP